MSYSGSPQLSPPANNQGLAIGSVIAGVLCGGCLGVIPGIVALVSASKVNNLHAQGDAHGALEAARRARTWAIIGFVVSAVIFVIVVVLQVAVLNSSDTTTY